MPAVEHIDAVRRLSPKTLIDVGANKGQFSAMARRIFPDLEIHAFEPLESERKVFKSVVSQPVTTYSTALGRTPGRSNFFVATRADSSSMFEPGAGQRSAYGVSKKHEIDVAVDCLQDALDFDRLLHPILLKIDVQGAELEVLTGVERELHRIDYIYCEASFVPLYEKQPLAHEIISYLGERGFRLRGVFNQSVTTQFGATQADFLFEL